MKRRHFALTLELGPDAVVRLLQLEQYATDLVGGKRRHAGPGLRARIIDLFPNREVSTVLDDLIGKAEPGWRVGAVRDGTQLLSIVTTDAGAAFSTIARILEVVAPEAFAKPMSFEPMQGRAHKALSTALH